MRTRFLLIAMFVKSKTIMLRVFRAGAVVCASIAGSAVGAATVEIALTEYVDREAALAAQSALLAGHTLLAYEDFEGFTSYDGCLASADCDASNTTNYGFASAAKPLTASVGTFTSILPQGSGGAQRPPKDAAVIRSNTDEANDGQPNSGRYNTDLNVTESANFIDSNDNAGILLDTSTGSFGLFNWISFILTDFDDVGELGFSLQVSGPDIISETEFNTVKQSNGDVFLVTLYFSDFVDDVFVTMNIDPGDGFGADSFAISVVPLPPSALLFLGGLAILGAASRRSRLPCCRFRGHRVRFA